MIRFSRSLLRAAGACLLIAYCLLARGQSNAPTATDWLTMSTDAVAPLRFVAVHGRRGLIMGYPQSGLEIWGYPVQILSGYHVGFRAEGSTSEMDGKLLLRRIVYRPQEVTRIYIGPDFVMKEKLFVPLDAPGAILTYEVEGRRHVDIDVHFTPVLNLMWPGAIGGQNTQWNAALSGYVISEPTNRFSAEIASHEIAAHDQTVNSTVRADSGLSFTLRPQLKTGEPATATVAVALHSTKGPDAAKAVNQLLADQGQLEAEAAAHYRDLAANTLQIETPDEDVNRALAWAEVALDQAWVCNPQLGCGEVAGYGPSRDARRPQYAWFFAGDGLIAADALAAAGEYSRAREELEFILRYQQPGTGMIWHEMSQSAGLMDWAKYPYMYVHVDITLQFLSAAADYVATSGDVDFARQHWSAIASAYRYCQSLLDPSTGLPRIPAGKEGSDEQDRMSDDIGLSSSWLAASAAYSRMAQETGHAQEAKDAAQASETARKAIAGRYWDDAQHFWISGHTESGKEIVDLRSGAAGLTAEHVFTPRQEDEVLDQLASAEFQTDWGSRGRSAASPKFDPDSYSSGSVSALGTSNMAGTFWEVHRPVIAFAMWNALLSWDSLDSLGHMHEVLAGDYFHQQTESVPEQTWSSAGFFRAAVTGLLGLQAEPALNRITFAPHLPAEWNTLGIRNVVLPHSRLTVRLTRVPDGLDLEVKNDGSAVDLVFDPEVPLGARVADARIGGHRLQVTTEAHPQDEHARMEFNAPTGKVVCHLRYAGGISIVSERPRPLLGDASHGVKITGINLMGDVLTVGADVPSASASSSALELLTPWKIADIAGGDAQAAYGGKYRITFDVKGQPVDAMGYSRIEARFRVQR